MSQTPSIFSGATDLVNGLAVPIGLGVIASSVRIMRFGWQSWRQLIASAFVSCFVAVLTYWGLDFVNFPPTVDAAIVGFSAYMGGSLLDAFVGRVSREVKKGDLNPATPEPDENKAL